MRHHIKLTFGLDLTKGIFCYVCTQYEIGSNTLSQTVYRKVYLEVEFYVVSQLREMCMLWCHSRKGGGIFF